MDTYQLLEYVYKTINYFPIDLSYFNRFTIFTGEKMNQIQIQKSQKELLYERVIGFVKENSSLTKDKIGDISRLLRCPCCDCDYFTYEAVRWLPYIKHRDNDRLKEILWNHYQLHLLSRIRLRGDKDHIRLFIKIFGKDFAKIKLKEYAQKSMLVYQNLKLVLKELEK